MTTKEILSNLKNKNTIKGAIFVPNWVENHINLTGDEREIQKMLNPIQTDEYGLGTVDFWKLMINNNSKVPTIRLALFYKGELL